MVVLNDITIYYDKQICGADILVEDMLKHFGEDYIEKLKENDNIVIRKHPDGFIEIFSPRGSFIMYFVPMSISNGYKGRRTSIALVPEHCRDTAAVNCIIWPSMTSGFLAYYDQKGFVKKVK